MTVTGEEDENMLDGEESENEEQQREQQEAFRKAEEMTVVDSELTPSRSVDPSQVRLFKSSYDSALSQRTNGLFPLELAGLVTGLAKLTLNTDRNIIPDQLNTAHDSIKQNAADLGAICVFGIEYRMIPASDNGHGCIIIFGDAYKPA